ncbi:universal stress protein [Shewanella sp. 10N.7]|uniref:universal stress protein n=1 Tax=Shewanella sp. 10N.7 TaxID=2885093 RepID=UPI001E437186|nr:universal stress protein [Shewanella sp. 10N.7]MCC4832486.1 universal stress protein [Shewanella sp. 10N.7]
MDKLYIIAQKNQQQANAVSAGIELAKKMNLQPEIAAYSYESFSGDAYYNPRIAADVRQQILATQKLELEQQLSDIAADMTPTDMHFNTSFKIPFNITWCKDLAEHACQQAKPQQYAMMLKAIHESDYFLPADWQLIRHTKVPLMLLTHNLLTKAGTILMAVDLGSNKPVKKALNQAVINQARRLAEVTGHELHLGFVIRIPKILRDMDILNSRVLIKEAYDKHQQAIEQIGIDRDHVHILAGNPDMCLFELSCRLNAEYLVMGAVQRQGIMGRVIGNTAEAILARSRSHILLIPQQAVD